MCSLNISCVVQYCVLAFSFIFLNMFILFADKRKGGKKMITELTSRQPVVYFYTNYRKRKSTEIRRIIFILCFVGVLALYGCLLFCLFCISFIAYQSIIVIFFLQNKYMIDRLLKAIMLDALRGHLLYYATISNSLLCEHLMLPCQI